jgi:Zn-dependent peptidase ImmA (M78 family)
MTYISPGRLYVQHRGPISSYEEILAYAEFLRSESGLNDKIPVDLQTIFRHFEIPEPKYVALSNQQGFLMDAERGLIAINSRDPDSRQKFTKAHELTEMLFSELPRGKDLGAGWHLNRPGGFRETTKEFLCNWTAANLLMPSDHTQTQLQRHGASFECARAIAAACEVSFSAALVQVARHSNQGHVVVLWRVKNKPAEIKSMSDPAQVSFFAVENTLPVKKLRVEWSMGGLYSPFIPKEKSTERTSAIFRAWETNAVTFGTDRMTFDNRSSGWYFSENAPFTLREERCVISLIKRVQR